MFHFMSLATPEAWIRLLRQQRGWPTPACLVTLPVALIIAAGAFVLTLPERLMLGPVLRWKFRGSEPRVAHAGGTLVILGYYRSGTTHLQNLLSCDPRLVTPRWVQALAPHGFWLSWGVLWAPLSATLGAVRPHDEVPFGPLWPAEDDFAANNWKLASSLPGRLIQPRNLAHYRRWQHMETLTDRERARWRQIMCAFLWKVTRFSGSRTLLLKSPSHTSRVSELRRLFADNVQFIVIERDRAEVIRSHLRMSKRLRGFMMQRLPEENDLRQMIEADFDDVMATMEAQLAVLPPDRVARMRFADLVRDPLPTLRTAYEALGLRWTDALETDLQRYLQVESGYQPRHASYQSAAPKTRSTTSARRFRGILAGLIGVTLAVGAWLLAAGALHQRMDPLAWALGFVVGLSVSHFATRGDRSLGLAAVGLYLLAFAVLVYLVPEVEAGWVGRDRWRSIHDMLSTPRVHLWAGLGLLTAYRCAARRHLNAPGRIL